MHPDATRKPADAAESTRRVLQWVFTFVLIPASFLFIFRQIARGWPQLANLDMHVSVPLVVGSVLLLLVNFFLTAVTWAVLFRDRGETVTIGRAFAIVFIAQIGKYIPGKIWMVLGQLSVATQWNYRKGTVLTTGVVHLFCGALGAGLVLAITTVLLGDRLLTAAAAFVFFVAGFGLLLSAPGLMENWINRIQKRRNAEPIQLSISRTALLKCVALMTLAWVVNCAAYTMFVSSVFPVAARGALELSYAFNLAYWLGFIVLFAPGGIGVREGSLTFMMTGMFGAANAGVIALAQRFWFLLAELIAFLIAMTIRKVVTSHVEDTQTIPSKIN